MLLIPSEVAFHQHTENDCHNPNEHEPPDHAPFSAMMDLARSISSLLASLSLSAVRLITVMVQSAHNLLAAMVLSLLSIETIMGVGNGKGAYRNG